MISAPARRMPVSSSIAAARSSSQPRSAAAFTIAYSPLTLNAATGTPNASLTRRMTSPKARAGLTITMSAPSSMSSATSRSASSAFAGSIWYERRSPKRGADSAASLNGA